VFAPGSVARLLSSGAACRVGELLGEGGQGAVHVATVDGSGERFALKWYFPGFATEQQWTALRALISRGTPSPAFLWPLDLVTAPDVGGFGYLMHLRPDGFTGMVDLVRGKVDVGFRQLATTGRELAHSFLLLHSEGLCYRDISFGNVFLRPDSGTVLICDVDNVGIDGAGSSTVRGTPYFMAPEIVRGEAMPSTRTDLFSLAVLLYYSFLLGHPLEGRRALAHQVWDVDAMADVFGAHPAFVFDPDDDGNRPVPGASVEQDNMLACWPVYPTFLRTLFVRAFTEGLAADGDRVRESEWRKAMIRLRDSVVFCGSCGRENLADLDSDGAPLAGDVPQRCWSCGVELHLPPRLLLGSHPVVLAHDTVLHPFHLSGRYDFSRPAAEIARHPSDPGIWGLRNLTAEAWQVREADGRESQIAPGRAVALTAGLALRFGPGHSGRVVT
jgi:eukaryotic-like serine/threonine-protein kinase